MPKKRYPAEQIIRHLREAEVELAKGQTTGGVCRKLGITEPDLLPMAEGVRELTSGSGEASEGTGRGEWPTEEVGSRSGVGPSDSEGDILGKLLSPPRRRQAVKHVCQAMGVSERRACRVVGQNRSTQRHRTLAPQDEPSLVTRTLQLAGEYGRYGYRRITALLRREGWRVNHKRVERIWRQEGLKVPKKQPRRGRLWLNDGSCLRLRPCWQDHVWAYDFVADRTHDGRPLKILTVVDEYTRECLAIDVERRADSMSVLERLAALFVERGVPDYLRSDNGSEFTARLVRDWLERVGVKTLFIEPASPWENGYVESFNGKFRDEFLNGEIFYTLREAKVLIEGWRREYNRVRPHSALGYRPPAPEVILPLPPGSAPLHPAATAYGLTWKVDQ